MTRHALVTHCTGYAGPGAVHALLKAGFKVFAQDPSFADEQAWRGFAAGRSGITPISADGPEAIIAAVFGDVDRLDAIVSNDHHPAPARPVETADIDQLRANHEALSVFPFALIQAALPRLKVQGGANIVMITSNRDRLPLNGGAFPDAARAAANALTRSLAVDLAPHAVTVNAVAPNFLYSEQFYPAAFYKQADEGRAYIEASVPTGQLAEPEEIGEVVVFLATAKTRHLTGAVIDFAGGWPFAPKRPV
ncbi:MAG: SDR family oxidoreductase [Oceanicaulis sp.]